jgi:tetratricopeptide (TPR) repeat protein
MTCLTFDQIIGYINDRLSSQEKTQAAKHLEECDLCREAMEAAASHPDKEELRSFVDAVGERFRSAINAQLGARRSDRGLYYRIAAVLVIGLAAVLYLSRDKPHEKLFAEYFEPYPNNIPVRRGEQPPGDLEQAALHYQVKEYAQALKHFEGYLESNPDSVNARFYAGVSYLATNDAEGAIACFQRVLKSGSNEFQKPAEWYLAVAYVKKNDLENARAVFNRISSYDGAYKEKAMEMVDRFDKLAK